MAELLLELFSEEIPARMQARAAEDLARLLGEALKPIMPVSVQTFHGPRRIALTAQVQAEIAAVETQERGPRVAAPEAALLGFLRKHGASRDDVAAEGEYWMLTKRAPAQGAAGLIGATLPPLLRRFPWPKSMRWGSGSAFTWVRPLRRILCILDGAIVPFSLADGADTGHGLVSGNVTEGHRFHAPTPFAVSSAAHWQAELFARRVIVDAAGRRRLVQDGVAGLAGAEGLTVVPDDGLLDEVAGLVEWPVPLLGRIDAAYMDLPPEVMQVSMRVNQRYFALRMADGSPAPRFAFAANIEASDGGTAIVAGNERVLRARFSDARYFWDLDRKTPLETRRAALNGVTYHTQLGNQAMRVMSYSALISPLAECIGADTQLANQAAKLAKADLTSGMVGEFPELQGVMGSYYAAGEDPAVALAIREHYAPRSPTDPVPTAPVSMTLALADKLDQLFSFFRIGEGPTGSGDPYALRRAALGVIRIIRENGLRIPLRRLNEGFAGEVGADVLAFIAERLRVQLRAEGARHDVLAAVFAAGADDDIVRLLARTDAVAAFLATPDGSNLLAASKRAANILRIEDKRDGPHAGTVDPALLMMPEEQALATAIDQAEPAIQAAISEERFADAMSALAALRSPLDAFFDTVTVNAPEPTLRQNRLNLLHRIGVAMALAADFSKIEG